MEDKNLSFEKFTRAIANLKLDDKSARPTAHTSSVVDFSNWDSLRREIESEKTVADAPRS